jgi:hypothetical protein
MLRTLLSLDHIPFDTIIRLELRTALCVTPYDIPMAITIPIAIAIARANAMPIWGRESGWGRRWRWSIE